ncbi:hypothetical protein [Mesorhizobium xinjiangense]|uniref:hypothetical protein n=1 Tax=Mesorhizobium xinjiangense TaxID=2678685 RepID=UPI0018DC92E8|nr:hypothetical protein [Mesorhizobium xinjiangense]
MLRGLATQFTQLAFGCAVALAPAAAWAQEFSDPGLSLDVPDISSFAPPMQNNDMPLSAGIGRITLSAQLTDDGAEVSKGLVWRIFKPEAGPDGKLPLVASAKGGTTSFNLDPGSYLVHASFGRAGATKRIVVDRNGHRESFVLDAGGLKLDAVLSGDVDIPPGKLRFSIYEVEKDANGERALIIPDVRSDTIVRLSAGTYHVVSTYGKINAVIRSDLRVEPGKLTEATVEHRAAQITLKLVREAGGEAIADTSWSVLTSSGDLVTESVGAFAAMVLSEGEYTVVAKNRDRLYQRDFEVVPGRNQDVEVITAAPQNAEARESVSLD